ncbi:MAG: hypothetical protein ACT4O0_13380 [Pseudonocardia sp.]
MIAGTALCVKARAAGPSAVFAALTVLFIVSTPVGSVLPNAVSGVFAFLDSITSPALNQGSDPGAPAPGTTTVSTRPEVTR